MAALLLCPVLPQSGLSVLWACSAGGRGGKRRFRTAAAAVAGAAGNWAPGASGGGRAAATAPTLPFTHKERALGAAPRTRGCGAGFWAAYSVGLTLKRLNLTLDRPRAQDQALWGPACHAGSTCRAGLCREGLLARRACPLSSDMATDAGSDTWAAALASALLTRSALPREAAEALRTAFPGVSLWCGSPRGARQARGAE